MMKIMKNFCIHFSQYIFEMMKITKNFCKHFSQYLFEMETAFLLFFALGGKSFGWFVCLHVYICTSNLFTSFETIS